MARWYSPKVSIGENFTYGGERVRCELSLDSIPCKILREVTHPIASCPQDFVV